MRRAGMVKLLVGRWWESDERKQMEAVLTGSMA